MAHPLFKMLAAAASSLRMTPWRKREKALSPETCLSLQLIPDSFAFPVAFVNPQGKIICINKCWVESRCLAGVLGESSIEPALGSFYQ